MEVVGLVYTQTRLESLSLVMVDVCVEVNLVGCATLGYAFVDNNLFLWVCASSQHCIFQEEGHPKWSISRY